MTVLITGGTGLVGSRLLVRLVERGVACRALVRPGKEVPAGVERAEGDVLDPGSLPAAVDGVSDVVHLAAVFRTRDEDLIWRVNLEGTRNLVAAVRQHAPRARLLMASTSNVYGPGLGGPGRETDETTATEAYPASKVAAEREVRDSGLTWVILRFPFVYGDGDGHLEAAPELLTRMGWHPARRLSVIHHEDIATAVELALTGAMDGRVVNLSDEAPLTVHEMAEIVGASAQPSREPLDNPWQGQVDASLARSLGFRPRLATVHQAAREGRL